MSSMAAVLYTVVGGVLGAALNQYVTHLRDRRTARALVIERLQEVETALAELRWPEETATITNDRVEGFTHLEKLLAALESSCLIAGIPRSAVAIYVTCCRLYEGLGRARFQADRFIKGMEIRRRPTLYSNEGKEELVQRVIDRSSSIKTGTTNMEKSVDEQREQALELLAKVVWHPYTILARRPALSGVEKATAGLESMRREFMSEIRITDRLVKELDKRSILRDKVPGAESDPIPRITR
jgi:hypothetical protein